LRRKSFLSFDRPEITRFTCRREPEARRGSRQSRGYDRDWEKLSAQVAEQEPLCCECEVRGRVTVGQLRDHTIPIRDRPELRLVRANIRNWCKQHHDTVKRALEAEARRLGDIEILTTWVADPSTRPVHLRP
jgi:5-methylcytosine-specific restriction enzyme A